MTDNPDPGMALRTAKLHSLKLADMQRCPNSIVMLGHYRPDGSCLCDDPNAQVMAEWGYKWNNKSKRWES